MTVDYELVLGMDRNHTLDRALREGLGVQGEQDPSARCAEYIREPRNLSEHREELKNRRERLEMAKRQLMGLSW